MTGIDSNYGIFVKTVIFIYLTALSVAQTPLSRMIGRLMNSELERIGKKAVVA
jgi:hypothetical protein